jgi:hypothetical protein
VTEPDALYQIRDLVSEEELGPVGLHLKPITGQGTKHIDSLWLDSAYTEESILACTLSAPGMLIEFPTDSEINFQIANSSRSLEYLEKAEDFCKNSLQSYYNSIKVLQNIATSQEETKRRSKLKAKRSFLMHNRDLPHLPQKLTGQKKSKWETIKYHKNKLLSQIQRNSWSKDPDYERIPFYDRQKCSQMRNVEPLEPDSISLSPSEDQEPITPNSPCVPRKSIGKFQSDDAGYLLPSEARQLVQDFRDQLQRQSSTSDEEPIYCNELYQRRSLAFEECMDSIVFNGDYSDGSIDCEDMDTFLMETMETLERKICSVEEETRRSASERWDQLETTAEVEDFLNAIFGACEIEEQGDCEIRGSIDHAPLKDTSHITKDCVWKSLTGIELTMCREEAETSF